MDATLLQSPAGGRSKQSAKKRRQRSKKQDAEKPGVGNIIQMRDDLKASEEVASSELKKDLYGAALTEDPLSETLKTDAGSIENHYEECANSNKRRKKKKKKKTTIEDVVKSMERTNMDQMNDDLKASSKVANSNPKKDTLETDFTEQPVSENREINAGSSENLSEELVNRKKKRKKKKKMTTQDEVQSMELTIGDQMNSNLEDLGKKANGERQMSLLETDLTEQLLSEIAKIDAGSVDNISGECVNTGKKRRKKKKKKKATKEDEVQQMELTDRHQMNASKEVANNKLEKIHSETYLAEEPLSENLKIEPGSVENLLGNKKRKRRNKKKKITVQDEVQPVEQTNTDQMNHDVEASEEVGISKLTKGHFETDLTSQSLLEIPKIVAGSVENLPKECANRKKKRKKKKKGTIQDEVQRVEPTIRDQMDGSLEAFENISNCKLKKDVSEIDLTQQPLSEYPEIDGALIENVSGCSIRKKKRKKKKAEIQDEVQSIKLTNIITGSTENPAEAAKEPTEKTDIKVVPGMDQTQIDTATTANLTEVTVTNKRKRKGHKKAKNDGEVEDKTEVVSMLNLNLSDENHEYRIDGELRSDDTNQGSKLSKRKEDQPCGSEHNMNGESLYPKIGLSTSTRKKLLVLDVNGLLADIIMCPQKHCSGDTRILGRSVYMRPFCDDFLKFCFQNFDVGIWSSRSMKVIHPIVNFLLGDLKNKLLFCWDMLQCTQTGLMTLENKHKPLVCKELRKIWGHCGRNSPWRKGDYNETNTLLLDDSPYKALLNPPHTAIFPYSYSYMDKEKDNSLGPEGDIRAYLEGLIKYDNVQKYVEQHPFGQKAISEEHSSWEFYKKVLSLKNDKTNSSLELH